MKSPHTFGAAYLRMTAWYVAIIMTISLLFSVWVYKQARSELLTGLNQVVELKMLENAFSQTPTSYSGVVSDQLQDSKGRLFSQLALLNVGVFVVGSVASYALARRTMRPIEESVEAQERFTADASHELRTPLTAMKTEIEVGLRDQKFSQEAAISLLKSNLEEIDRLGNLADGLLALTQTNAPRSLTSFSLDDAAEKVAKRMQPLAAIGHIELKRDLHPVTVLSDEVALDKIISIVFDNAIKYSPGDTTITISVYQKDGQAFVTVADQGVGIKASELPHIFDRFYRADSSRSKSNVVGHGLGLSIAQKLAQNLGAEISATSSPGKGSEFTLRINLA